MRSTNFRTNWKLCCAGAVIGLRDGTISSDGLDTFKLGYEFVRDEIGLRREHLKRHPPSQDDKVVAVKTAQSA